MSEIDEFEDDDSKNPESIELVRDSNRNRNTVSAYSVGYNTNQKLNQTSNTHNQIAHNLADESQEEIDENNDADPEKVDQHEDDMNKTFDGILILQLFGRKDPNEKIIPFESKKAKLLERMLHPIQYGSLRGSIFGLSSMCLEAGALVLAIRCKQFGLVNFLLALVLGGLCAYWTLVMMIKAGRKAKQRDYSKTVKTILGNKWGIFVDLNIAIYLLGAVISFQVIIYQILGAVVYDIMKILRTTEIGKYDNFEKFKDDYWRKNLYIKLPVMAGVALLVFPLCLLKDVSKMRFASLIGVLALIYSIIVIIIESFFFLRLENWNNLNEMNWFDIRKAFSKTDGIPFFGGIATVFYIYSCHAGAFPVYKTLRNNTTRRIKKVFRRSILLDIIIYTFVAAASFITAPIKAPELILYRENLTKFDPDYFIIIAKVGIIFNLFFSTPANYSGLRISLFELIWGNSNITNMKNICVTFIVLLIVVTVGALYDEILQYIELLGGFCSVIYCFFMPGIIYVKSNQLRCSFKNILTVFVLIILLLIGYLSGILTILVNMINIKL